MHRNMNNLLNKKTFFDLKVQELSKRSTQHLLHKFIFSDKKQDAQTRPGERMQDRVVIIKYVNTEGDLEKKENLVG